MSAPIQRRHLGDYVLEYKSGETVRVAVYASPEMIAEALVYYARRTKTKRSYRLDKAILVEVLT